MRGTGTILDDKQEVSGSLIERTRAADPFELWLLAWRTAVTCGMERLVEVVPGPVELPDRGEPPDLSALPVMRRLRIELPTMLFLEQIERKQARKLESSVLIVAPYAVHDASIGDFADNHSVAQVLSQEHSVAMTFWKSANRQMRYYAIDTYLSDLNVAIDELGGRVSLVGLCQGGWLAAIYASRFPDKVSKLVLAGAPINPGAAESRITRALLSLPPSAIDLFLKMSGGIVHGRISLAAWVEKAAEEYEAATSLQSEADGGLIQKFDAWNARTVNLPGAFFQETTEWLFRENRLARDCFPALGRLAGLSSIVAPTFVLAAAEDEVVPLAQATAMKTRGGASDVAVRVEPGRHLSLFMGYRTLAGAWREITDWLKEDVVRSRRGRTGSVHCAMPDRKSATPVLLQTPLDPAPSGKAFRRSVPAFAGTFLSTDSKDALWPGSA